MCTFVFCLHILHAFVFCINSNYKSHTYDSPYHPNYKIINESLLNYQRLTIADYPLLLRFHSLYVELYCYLCTHEEPSTSNQGVEFPCGATTPLPSRDPLLLLVPR